VSGLEERRTTGKVTLLVALASLAIGATVAVVVMKAGLPGLWSSERGAIRSGAGDEIMVMRTRGGLLEVSRIQATEVFDTRFVHTFAGIRVGETVPRIRVPALYRYHIELAPEWRVLRTDDTFTVVAPPAQPSLPVAVDLARMEKDVAGTWVLLPFTGEESLDDLERGITAKLAQKAALPAYIQLQREDARRTVAEFVRKWLLTQVQWRDAAQPRLRVLFADEPVGSIDTIADVQRP
jgi:hypothetical protein